MSKEHRITIGRRVLSAGLGEEVVLDTRDRSTHLEIIGASGQGKTELVKQMIIQDMRAGKGFVLIDPMGALARYVIDRTPDNRKEDVLIFNPSDLERPVPINILDRRYGINAEKIASNVHQIMKGVWHYSWGPNLEEILKTSIVTLLEVECEPTMLGVERLLTNADYRHECIEVLEVLKKYQLKNFWQNRYDSFRVTDQDRKSSSTLNKASKFCDYPLRNHFGQGTNSYDLRELMEKQKIVIVDLSQQSAAVGVDQVELLGATWVALLDQIARLRGSLPPWKRHQFYAYFEELPMYPTVVLKHTLAQIRQFGLSVGLIHQDLDQLVFNNNTSVREQALKSGTFICFRVGPQDAKVLSDVFNGEIKPHQFTDLPPGYAYVKRSHRKDELPFKVELYRRKIRPTGNGVAVRRYSRDKWGRKRRTVARDLIQWYRPRKRRGRV